MTCTEPVHTVKWCGCPDRGILINHEDGCKHMICITARHNEIPSHHSDARKMKTAEKMVKTARKKLMEVAMAFLVHG